MTSLKKIILLIFFCGFSSTVFASSSVKITSLQVQKHAPRYRFVLTANAPIRYHQFQLSHPDRFVIDIPKGRLSTSLKVPFSSTSPVKKIRTARQPNGDLRLVFDLKYLTHIATLTFQHPDRLIIDFPSAMAVSSMNAIEKKKPLHDVVVVIDPGHGGKDPGATGPRGTHEKNIVLSIARKLQGIINHQPGFKAVLTRNRDVYLPLRKRLAIARRYKGDMFVAIHADAYRNRTARGASVYALSNRGATSEAARWLAKRENASELMGGVELSDKGHLLKSVLINLSQTATIRASLMIGSDLIHFLDRIAFLHHGRVEQAAFVVLKSPDIPSLLVETGFLSNPYEERRLRNPEYQNRIALAIMKGIRNYYAHQPPRNTWLAYWRDHPRKGRQQYIVHRGDTLTGVSQRYQVSVAQLKQLNNLHTAYLREGQVLSIPAT